MIRHALEGVPMPKSQPADEFPAQTFDTFYSLRNPDDPEPVVEIEPFPTSIPDPPTTAAKSARKSDKES